ncbi:MAG TPA: putative methyltransferase [Bacteroidetes bacterium]|nr:putative methyltransferase [Bacteroidota bacterium]
MQRIFEKIRESAGLEISQYAFDKILRAMATDSYGWRIVDISDQPFNLVAETLKQMENTGYLKFVGSRIDLTRNGKNLLRQRGIYPKADFRCTHCKGTGYDVSTYEEMIAKFNETLEKLPRPESIQNRWIMTPESIFRRAMLMVQKGNSAGKEIVILKDADLLSLALALTRLTDKITVLEDNREMADYLFNLSHTRSSDRSSRI